MTGSKKNPKSRATALRAMKNPPSGGDFAWDGFDENERPLTGGEMQAGITQARSRGRPAGSDKESTSIPFDRDVLDAIRADGAGWQSRMNATLRNWLKKRGAAWVGSEQFASAGMARWTMLRTDPRTFNTTCAVGAHPVRDRATRNPPSTRSARSRAWRAPATAGATKRASRIRGWSAPCASLPACTRETQQQAAQLITALFDDLLALRSNDDLQPENLERIGAAACVDAPSSA